jgi:hypothetical protein
MTEKEQIGCIALALIALTLLSFAIGIGYIFGPGAGWIAVGLICLLGVYGVLKMIAAHAKAEQAKPDA